MDKKKHGKILVGKVISRSTPNTVIVEITTLFKHPIYKKSVRRTRHLPAHVEGVECAVGDTVRIAETRPISKTKHFRVI